MSDSTETKPTVATPGLKECPFLPLCWVQFKTSGYPFSLTDRIDHAGAKNSETILNIILEYVVDWNLTDIGGLPVTLPPLPERRQNILDNVDEAVITWLIRSFYRVRGELIEAKNSLPPSPATA